MKNFKIELKIGDDVARYVYELTANVAKERGETKHIATEDNEIIIGFIKSAAGILFRGLGSYAKEYNADDECVRFVICVPENWSEEWFPIHECKMFLANYSTAKWVELSGMDSSLFLARSQEALDNIGYSLDRRLKPL